MSNTGNGFVVNLRRLRIEAGLTQTKIADEVYSEEKNESARRQKYGRIERGEVKPSREEISRIAEVIAEELGLAASNVQEELSSEPARREKALEWVGVIRDIADMAHFRLSIMVSKPDEEMLKKAREAIEESQMTLSVLERLAMLVPERVFWEAFIKYICFSAAGTKMQNLYSLLASDERILSDNDRKKLILAVKYLKNLEKHGIEDFGDIDTAMDSPPPYVMKLWIDTLRRGDEVTATHYVKPEFSWNTDDWYEYHRANVRAAYWRGVKITRYFIYNEKEELDKIDKILVEQDKAGINVRILQKEEAGKYVLDIAVFLKVFLAVLNLDANTRKPTNLELLSMQDYPAQRAFVHVFKESMDVKSKQYKSGRIVSIPSNCDEMEKKENETLKKGKKDKVREEKEDEEAE